MIPIAISTAIFLYLLASFVTMNPNPKDWGIDNRIMLAILIWPICTLLTMMLYFPSPSDVTLLGN